MKAYLSAIICFQGTLLRFASRAGNDRLFFAQAWFWVCLICLVFAIGLWLLVRFRSFLGREERALQSVQDRLEDFFQQNKGWDQQSESVLLQGVIRESLAARVVEIAHKLRKRGVSMDLHETRNLADSEVHRRMTGARYVAGSLILFGLMGTLVGLSYTVKQLAAAAQQVEANLGEAAAIKSSHARYSSEQAVQNLLVPWQNGMNNAAAAFFASLSGVGGTVLFLFLLSFAQKKGALFNSRLNVFVLTDLIPFMSPPEKQQSFERIVAELSQSNRVLREMGQSIASQVDAAGRDLQMAEMVLRNCDAREAQFLEEMQRATSIQQEAAGKFIEVSESTKSLSASCADMLSLLRFALERFETESTNINVKLSLVMKRAEEGYLEARNFYREDPGFSWSALADSSREQTNQLRSVVEQLEGIHGENSQTQQTFLGIREVFQQQLERGDLSDAALNRLPEESFWASLLEKVNALPSAVAKIEAMLQQLTDSALKQKRAEQEAETRLGTDFTNPEIARFQGAVVAAIEKGLSGRFQRENSAHGGLHATGEPDRLGQHTIKEKLDEQLRLQNELLSYNRKMFLILSRTHALKSAKERFLDFWFRRDRDGIKVHHEQ